MFPVACFWFSSKEDEDTLVSAGSLTDCSSQNSSDNSTLNHTAQVWYMHVYVCTSVCVCVCVCACAYCCFRAVLSILSVFLQWNVGFVESNPLICVCTFKMVFHVLQQIQVIQDNYNPRIHQIDVTSPDHPLLVPRTSDDTIAFCSNQVHTSILFMINMWDL